MLFNLLGLFPAILACVAWPLLRNAQHTVDYTQQALHCRRSDGC
jgi:hypothetical protein